MPANLRLVSSKPAPPEWQREVSSRVLAWKQSQTEKAREAVQHPVRKAVVDILLTLLAAIVAFGLIWTSH